VSPLCSRCKGSPGSDAEDAYFFIRLVSAIGRSPRICRWIIRTNKLEKQGVTDLIEQSTLPKELKIELKTVFDVRKSRKNRPLHRKTLQRILQGGNFKAKQLKINAATSAKC